MSENPYEAPKSHIELSPSHEATGLRPAGKGARFLNLIIDYVAYILFAMVIGLFIGLIGSEAALVWIQENETVAGLVIILCYYVLMEGVFGRTLGKLITGCKVVTKTGDKPSFGQVLGRTFARLIPFEAFSFLGSEGRGWHDSLSNTYVVKVR